MIEDEIIEMAKQAGLSIQNPQYGYTERHHVAGWITDLEAFAKLAAAKEREACATLCDDKQDVHPYRDLGTLIRARGNL